MNKRITKHRVCENTAFEAAVSAANVPVEVKDEQELRAILARMLGMAELDLLDEKSNEWRSAMIDARSALG